MIIATKIIPVGQDSADTHTTKWFKILWREVAEYAEEKILREARGHFALDILDPFARNCQIAYPHTNDLNPESLAQHNLDALEFLKQYHTATMDIIIFDPPFSERRANEHYDGLGVNLYASDSKKMTECLYESLRVLRRGGYLLKFGYNCNVPAPGFELAKLWIISKRGNANATIVSLWECQQYKLDV